MAGRDQSRDDAEAFLSEIKEEGHSKTEMTGSFVRLADYLQRKKSAGNRARGGEDRPFTRRWKALQAYRKQKSSV